MISIKMYTPNRMIILYCPRRTKSPILIRSLTESGSQSWIVALTPCFTLHNTFLKVVYQNDRFKMDFKYRVVIQKSIVETKILKSKKKLIILWSKWWVVNYLHWNDSGQPNITKITSNRIFKFKKFNPRTK